MNEYMILVSENDAATAAEQARVMEGRAAYTEQLKKSGALLDGERLRKSGEARRVHFDGAKARVTSGPFGDALSSYLTVQAKDLDSAITLAKQLPTLPGDAVEVRPIMKGQHDPNKTDKTGKLFAFGVLGNAPNEEAWIRIMNTIDNDTHDTFPPGFVGGVRLEAPRTGRRLMNQHGKTVVLDGPFLESKEVIGGLFFCRMASLEDALTWVENTAFVRLGGCEIREVWRS